MKLLVFTLCCAVLVLLADKLTGVKLWDEPLACGFIWYIIGLASMAEALGDP